MQITVVVAHAPVKQQPRNECIESLVDFASLVVLMDANACRGSLHSQHGEPQMAMENSFIAS